MENRKNGPKQVLKMITPIGRLTLAEREGKLTDVTTREVAGEEAETELLTRAARELDEYFAGTRRAFDLPITPEGTEFQRRVWEALVAVPYGTTITYARLAEAAGSPRAVRAAGRACGANPLLIVVPCHRAVGKGGKLTGFAAGLGNKELLLRLEGALL